MRSGEATVLGDSSVVAHFSFGGGRRCGGRDILRGMAALDPLVNFGGEELPQPSKLVGGHFLAGDPFVNGIPIDAQVRRNLFDR